MSPYSQAQMKARWPLIGLSYVLAAVIFAVNELFWGILWFRSFHVSEALLRLVNASAKYVGPPCFLAWCVIARGKGGQVGGRQRAPSRAGSEGREAEN